MIFDRKHLTVRSIADRCSLVFGRDAKSGMQGVPACVAMAKLQAVAECLRNRTGPAIWFIGGHVFKANVGWYLSDLIQCGYVDHIATTGAGLVHQWELSTEGQTSEHVPTAIRDGSFGLWKETGRINELISEAASRGESIGTRARDFYATYSSRHSQGPFRAAMDKGIPVTIHVSIGQDVFCEHPNCDGAALGKAGYQDFLEFTQTVSRLQGGVYLSFGSAVASPEIFLKSLAMARNANAGKPNIFSVFVFDCCPLPADPKDAYFNRPCKTLLGRATVGDNVGFVQAKHEESIPNLWALLREGAA